MSGIKPSELRDAFDEALGIASEAREARQRFVELGDRLKKTNEDAFDWAQFRSLAVAHDADIHDEKKHDRVSKLLGKGAYAKWYADILKLNETGHVRSSEQSPSAVPIPDTPPRDGGAAAPAATGRASTAAADPGLRPSLDSPGSLIPNGVLTIPPFCQRNPDNTFVSKEPVSS